MDNLDATRRGILTIVSGKNAGDKIELTEGLTTLGTLGVQVAAVSKRPQGFFTIHVDGSKDKDKDKDKDKVPLVNEKPIGFKSHKLENGDRIEIAGLVMAYKDSE